MYSSRYTQELFLFLKSKGSPAIALQQSKYMKNRYPFIGLKRDDIKKYLDEYESFAGKIDSNDSIKFCKECVAYPQREMWYIGLNQLKKHKKTLQIEDLEFVQSLIVTGDWWDVVDMVASHFVGSLAYRFPSLKVEVNSWMHHPNMWLRRSSIIYQLSYGKETDTDFLFLVCRELAHEKDFFIRKAIGWALRDYSKDNPKAVKNFIESNLDILSPLSILEGSKYV